MRCPLVLTFLVLTAPAAAQSKSPEVGLVVLAEGSLHSEISTEVSDWLARNGHRVSNTALDAEAISLVRDCFVLEDAGCVGAVVSKRATTSSLVLVKADGGTVADASRDLRLEVRWYAGGEERSETHTCSACTADTLRIAVSDVVARAAPASATAQATPTAGTTQVTVDPAASRSDPSASDKVRAKIGILAGAKVGGIVPLDGLSPFVSGGVEVGYLLAAGRIAIVLGIDYTQPSKTGEESDPRVAGGAYTWKLTEQQLGMMVTAIYRMTWMKPVVPYAGIGPRVVLLRSSVRDDGSPAIMKTTETSTGVGLGIPIGAELRVGPGALIGELLVQYGTLDHVATGESHTGAVSLGAGYRILF